MIELLEEKELPRDCASCKYYGLNCADGYSCRKLMGREIYCNFTEGMGVIHKDCPLKLINKLRNNFKKEYEQLNKIKAEKEAINFLLMESLKLACKTLHNVCITQNYMLGLGQDEIYFINKGLENIRKEIKQND